MELVQLSGRPKDKLIQFARNLEDCNLKKLHFPMLWSEKIDGVYCLALKLGGRVEIYSRTGERYTSMKHIAGDLNRYMNDGEIIIFEASSYDTDNQSTISGWARDTKQQHNKLVAVCHTYITLDDFKGIETTRYLDGYKILYNRIKFADRDILTIADQGMVNSIDEAMEIAKKIWAEGGEGVVLRNPDAFWHGGKRNEEIIKIKEKITLDLEVVDVFEGKGKYKGMLGGVVCRYDNGTNLNVGSGFTDAERGYWWAVRSEIIGLIVEIEAMKESSKGKLREPRFKGVRHDKTKGDF